MTPSLEVVRKKFLLGALHLVLVLKLVVEQKAMKGFRFSSSSKPKYYKHVKGD